MERENEQGSQTPRCLTERGVIHCSGRWTIEHLEELEALFAGVDWPAGPVRLSLAEVSALDTAGAWLLLRKLRALRDHGRDVALEGLN